MSEIDEAPPPMGPKLRALLVGARGAFDEEAKDHVHRALERLAHARPDLDAPPEPPAGGSPVSASGGAATAATGAKLAPVVLSLLAGAAIGAAAMFGLGPARERVVYVDGPEVTPASPSASATMVSVRIDNLPPAPSAVPPAIPAPAIAAPPAASAHIAAERLLLDEARASFASGDYAQGLDRLKRHKERFSAGVLAEEREALAVRTLAALGRKPEAVQRARAFVVKYPESIMRPAVEGSVTGF